MTGNVILVCLQRFLFQKVSDQDIAKSRGNAIYSACIHAMVWRTARKTCCSLGHGVVIPCFEETLRLSPYWPIA